jgi:hypothetical protein
MIYIEAESRWLVNLPIRNEWRKILKSGWWFQTFFRGVETTNPGYDMI